MSTERAIHALHSSDRPRGRAGHARARRKQYLRVEHDDDDDIIAALIAGSRIHVETQTRRALITQTWRLTRDAWPESGWLAVLPVPLRRARRRARLPARTAPRRRSMSRPSRSTRAAAPARLALHARRASRRRSGRSPASRSTSPAAMATTATMCPSRCGRRSGCWSRTGTRTAGWSRSASRSRCCRRPSRR